MNNSILYTVHDIYLLIKRNLKFVIIFSIGFLFLGFIYTLFATRYYESYISINPQDYESKNMADLMTISSIMGLGSVQESNSTFYIPDVINSRKLKLDIVNKKWKTEEFQDGVNLMKYWGFTKTNIMEDSLLHIATQLAKSTEKKASTIIEEWRLAEEDAIGKLENNLYVIEEESGLIKIRVLMEEPQLAADIVNYISEFLVTLFFLYGN